MILAGIDLAWQGKNTSAIAVGNLHGTTLTLLSIDVAVPGPNSVLDCLLNLDGLVGIAVDAPLIIENPTGQRPCETAIGREYGSRHAACHTSNTSLYPDAVSVQLAKTLILHGFQHLHGEKWQIEVYPHPAIIELFQLSMRHEYKKGPKAKKQSGQRSLGTFIRNLGNSNRLTMHLNTAGRQACSGDYIDSLTVKALKSNEDALDAIICLYIAGLYALGCSGKLFGDQSTGYIWIPRLD